MLHARYRCSGFEIVINMLLFSYSAVSLAMSTFVVKFSFLFAILGLTDCTVVIDVYFLVVVIIIGLQFSTHVMPS